MDLENIISKTVTSTKANGNKTSSTARESTYNRMETNIMKGNSKMARKTDSVFFITFMVPYIKANGRTT